MSENGLRARKKRETHEAIAEAAFAMMVERGFSEVSVADIAEAAHVSKVTVFNYFPTKEDIVLSRIEDHTAATADAVRDRGPGESPFEAIRAHAMALIKARDPVTGLSDGSDVLAFGRLVLETPTLRMKLIEQRTRERQLLSAALLDAGGATEDELTCDLAAIQIVSVLWALAERNLRAILAGASPRVVAQSAVDEAERAFGLLRMGLEGKFQSGRPRRTARTGHASKDSS